jgi:DNA-binding MarR family transcriptional regulator
MPQQDLCISMHHDPNNSVLLLNEMESAGHVRRSRDPADRRRHIVRLTPAGKRALAKLRALARQLDDDFLASLDEDERVQLHALVLRLAEQHLPHCAPKTPTA